MSGSLWIVNVGTSLLSLIFCRFYGSCFQGDRRRRAVIEQADSGATEALVNVLDLDPEETSTDVIKKAMAKVYRGTELREIKRLEGALREKAHEINNAITR